MGRLRLLGPARSCRVTLGATLAFAMAVTTSADGRAGGGASRAGSALEPGEQLLYGADYAFAFRLPGEWRLDLSFEGSELGKQGLACPGGQCKASKANIWWGQLPRLAPALTAAGLLQVDIEMTLSDNPTWSHMFGKSLADRRGQPVPTVHYKSPDGGHQDLVAVMDLGGRLLGLSLVTTDPAAFEKAREPFEAVVKSLRRIPFDGESKDGGKTVLGTPPAWLVRRAILDRCSWACDVRTQMLSMVGDPTAAASGKRCEESCHDEKALQKAVAAPPSPEIGRTLARAFEVCTPAGAYAVLDDLRCPDGKAATWKRLGQAGTRSDAAVPAEVQANISAWDVTPIPAGTPDYHIVDKYEVKCGATTQTLFIDIFHCIGPQPWAAPEGFTRPLRMGVRKTLTTHPWMKAGK